MNDKEFYNFRIYNTIEEIQYFSNWDDYWDLFNKCIDMLKTYISTYKELSEEDQELLLKVYEVGII